VKPKNSVFFLQIEPVAEDTGKQYFVPMPTIYVIGGCNGAGKTTLAYTLLPEFLQCNEYVNADAIANGLSAFNQNAVAMDAGRVMLIRIKSLLQQHRSFAFETTMASKIFIPLLEKAKIDGYDIHLLFVLLTSPDLAVERVAIRKQSGGHDVPIDVILRRYFSGRKNFVELYMPLAHDWQIVDNTANNPIIVANKKSGIITVFHESIYNHVLGNSI
jgi:predicted ABC-type ATPase